jgi:hypothetical protein
MQQLSLDTASVAKRVKALPDRIVVGKRLAPEEGDSDDLKKFDLDFWEANITGVVNVLVGGNFDSALKLLTPEDLTQVDAILIAGLDPFVSADEAFRDITSRARRRPQLAFAAGVTDPQSPDSRKTFGLEGIYTKGLGDLWNVTANVQYKRPEAVADDDALTLSALLRRQVKPKIAGHAAMYLDIASDASLLHGKRTYRAQAKATVSLISGLQIPVSITWANHADLVKESNVTGHVGISFDFSKASDFFKRSLPTK